MSKKGVSAISGITAPTVGEKYIYNIVSWYPDTPQLERNLEKVTWELFKRRKNGTFTTTNIKKIGHSYFTFGEAAAGETYKLQAYLYAPEGGGLIITPKPAKVPKINKVELFYIDDSKGLLFSPLEKLRAKAYCVNMLGKDLIFTLWEDDAKGAGHNSKNLPVATLKAQVNKDGVAAVDFSLSTFMFKAAMGERDSKLEFYVTVEYFKDKKHASNNIDVNNPYPAVPVNPPKKLEPKKTEPKKTPVVKGSPAETKGNSKKEEKGIWGSLTESISKKGGELWDWAESVGTVIKDKMPTVQKPDGKSPAIVKEVKQEKKNVGKCECFCDRDITPSELKEMIVAMRKATFDDAGENFYKWNKDHLFTSGHEQFIDKSYTKFAEVLNKAFTNYDINSCIRKIHFLAQCYHETGAFMRSVEGALNDDFWYDPFRGRGFIHLTLEGNYQKFKKNSGYDVVNNPKIVSTNIEAAAMSSGWYWKYNDMGNINPFADKDSIFDTSRLVNKPNAKKSSSINGYNQRVNALNALKTVFKYPQSCCNLGKIEKISKNKVCSSGLEDCICKTAFNVENGFINHSLILKDHIKIIEHGNYKNAKTSIQKIILHRTAGSTTEACKIAFKNGRKNKSGGTDHYGTHFIVGKDGKIHQTADLRKITWHCKGWNSKAIGIEVVGCAIDKNGKCTLGLKGQLPVAGWEDLTEDQAKTVACLVKSLLNYYALSTENIDCHEHLASKEKGEGQIVLDAIKPYLK